MLLKPGISNYREMAEGGGGGGVGGKSSCHTTAGKKGREGI